MCASPATAIAVDIARTRARRGALQVARDAVVHFLFVLALVSGLAAFYLFFRVLVLDAPVAEGQASVDKAQEFKGVR
jgi:hypothetical protein